ncbi:MAG: S-layer homology domain-containing protein, partial [Chloroflexia bacterium]
AADTWTAKANELAADNVPGSSIVNGKLWVYGGGNPFSGNAKKSTSAFNAPATTGATQIYDPGTDTCTNGPSLNVARSFVGGTTVGNYTVAVGGYTGSSTTATTEVSNNPGSPCVTASPTSPAGTATATSSPGSSATATTQATATATACTGSGNYTVTTGTGVLVPATNDIGNACDDCSTSIILPFPVQLYDQTYTAANIGSNGYIAFGTDAPNYTDITCLPGPTGTYLIAPYWTDQDTDPLDGCTDCGIFTSTTGIAPNRTFNVEFRNIYYAETGAHDLDYEVQLHEGQSTYNVVYGLITPASVANDSPLTVGVQKDNTLFTEVGCDPSGGQAPPVSTGQMLTFSLPSCVTGTPTAPPANTATATTQPANTATATTQPVNSPTATTQPVNSPTATTQPAASPTATTRPFATATPTPCSINFSDVHMSDYFYVPVQYLYCHGVISGYSDGTFRPYNNTTRSQMVKIVVLGFNKAIVTPTGGAYTFTDVTPANPFFSVVETAAADGIVSGYNCGVAPAGPCDSQNRPYFLPYNYVTRGQLSKIDVIAAGWALYNPPVGHFIDVIPGSVFYTVIETAYCHGVISGYSDRTFRPYNNAIRGQIAKIVYLSIVNPPVTCGP